MIKTALNGNLWYGNTQKRLEESLLSVGLKVFQILHFSVFSGRL